MCENVCAVINTYHKKEFKPKAYECRDKDKNVRLSSSSGGVFTSLCEYVIDNEGVIFGVAFNDKFEVEHMEAANIEECKKFRGSKYVQSKIGITYKLAKQYLDKGRLVLFSGTPCQVKGLNLFLRKKYDNLILVDIVCHGVPSPLVFDIYKKSLEKNYNSKINSITFRDKSIGWKNYKYKISFENNKQDARLFIDNIYSKGFLNDLYLRPSCYSCEAKDHKSNSDITLADYWGVQNKHSGFDDDKGVSFILINSKKGKKVFDIINDKIEGVETDLEYAIYCNPCIVKSVRYNKKREKFFRDLNTKKLEENIMKNIKPSITQKVKNKIRFELSKINNKITSTTS